MAGRTAFLYDFLAVPGGAERVALHVSELLSETEMVFGFVDRGVFPESEYPPLRFRSLTSSSKISGWQGIKAVTAFNRKTAFLNEFETVIYSGVYAPLAVKNHIEGRNIYYCHTPPRFIYDLRRYYEQLANRWQKPVLKALGAYLRPRYEESVKAMHVVLANSANVKGRLEKYINLQNVQVLHPPVDTKNFTWQGQEGYYLSTARLEAYKRVELIVKAFMDMPDKRLIVSGGGSQSDKLKKLASEHENIAFTGWCTNTQMQRLIGQCIATLYMPIDEDFGISPVESMAAGKPVIGVAQGGLLETIVDEETGLLIDPDELERSGVSAVEAIGAAVGRMDARTARSMRESCELRSQRFDQHVFDQGLAKALNCPT